MRRHELGEPSCQLLGPALPQLLSNIPPMRHPSAGVRGGKWLGQAQTTGTAAARGEKFVRWSPGTWDAGGFYL